MNTYVPCKRCFAHWDQATETWSRLAGRLFLHYICLTNTQGSLRCDVNVSVNRPGAPFGTRCEIKNLNSVKFMMVAIGLSRIFAASLREV